MKPRKTGIRYKDSLDDEPRLKVRQRRNYMTSKKRITVRISPSQLERLEGLVYEHRASSVSDCVRLALDYWLQNQMS